mmetsp:Transcript_6686/g.20826  ORF Transcript_6686/g.20826 Transcript_6686/m.20826 type:complete len:205 (-) Transcript_6686:1623-2237(-)
MSLETFCANSIFNFAISFIFATLSFSNPLIFSTISFMIFPSPSVLYIFRDSWTFFSANSTCNANFFFSSANFFSFFCSVNSNSSFSSVIFSSFLFNSKLSSSSERTFSFSFRLNSSSFLSARVARSTAEASSKFLETNAASMASFALTTSEFCASFSNFSFFTFVLNFSNSFSACSALLNIFFVSDLYSVFIVFIFSPTKSFSF